MPRTLDMSARLSMSLGTGADNTERDPKANRGRKNCEKNISAVREVLRFPCEEFNL